MKRSRHKWQSYYPVFATALQMPHKMFMYRQYQLQFSTACYQHQCVMRAAAHARTHLLVCIRPDIFIRQLHRRSFARIPLYLLLQSCKVGCFMKFDSSKFTSHIPSVVVLVLPRS